jgi:hypothetical protein
MKVYLAIFSSRGSPELLGGWTDRHKASDECKRDQAEFGGRRPSADYHIVETEVEPGPPEPPPTYSPEFDEWWKSGSGELPNVKAFKELAYECWKSGYQECLRQVQRNLQQYDGRPAP